MNQEKIIIYYEEISLAEADIDRLKVACETFEKELITVFGEGNAYLKKSLTFLGTKIAGWLTMKPLLESMGIPVYPNGQPHGKVKIDFELQVNGNENRQPISLLAPIINVEVFRGYHVLVDFLYTETDFQFEGLQLINVIPPEFGGFPINEAITGWRLIHGGDSFPAEIKNIIFINDDE